MRAIGRRALLLTFTAAAAGLCGCDAATLAYFLSPETKEQPGLAKVVSEDKKKVTKLMILPSLSQDLIDKEYLQADRDLGTMIYKQMNTLLEVNGQKMTIISPYKVEEFKSKHPNWQNLEPAAIGRQFNVDYVMLVDIQSMSMYEPGSSRQLYRGRMNLEVSLITVNHPDTDPQTCSLNLAYPSDAKPAQVDADMPWPQFRMKFLTNIAKQITWKFLEHEKHDEMDVSD